MATKRISWRELSEWQWQAGLPTPLSGGQAGKSSPYENRLIVKVLIIAYLVFRYIKRHPNGSLLMQEVEDMIHEVAMISLTTSVITQNGGPTRCCTERRVKL